ncbi:MAG TPA: hypothetical protein VGO47_05885, partial [Chlamydiales bacterium]|nr:hypothetical protein [Chlamydiales bacterium]
MQKTTNLILCVLFLALPLLPAFATERRTNLAYVYGTLLSFVNSEALQNSQNLTAHRIEQKLHVLPELALRNMEPHEQIIFLHIPKTAGTNLDTIAKAVSKERGNFHYQRFSVPRVAGRSPILITPDWIGGLKQLESNSV